MQDHTTIVTPLLIVVVTTSAIFQAKQQSDCCTLLVCSCKRSSNNRATIKVDTTSICSAACHIFRFFLHPDCIDIHIGRLNMLKVMGMWWCILIAFDWNIVVIKSCSLGEMGAWVAKTRFVPERRRSFKDCNAMAGLATFLNMEWTWNATGTVWKCIWACVVSPWWRIIHHPVTSVMQMWVLQFFKWRCSKRGHRCL
jgi:hypothetical protein